MTPALFFALDLFVKATVVIAVAAMLSTLLIKRAAAIRHLIWAGALLVVAALPLVVPAAPTIAITVPLAAAAPSVARREPIVADRAQGSAPSRNASRSTYWHRSPVTPAAPVQRQYWWLALWFAGVIVLIARIVVGQVRIGRVIARGEDAMALVGAGTVAALAAQQQVTHAPRVLLSNEVESPLMCGTRHPVVVLPRSAEEWSAERIRIVLIHELAHIARCDHLAQLVGELACAAFWIHPAVWYAAAQLRRESEHAADDRVISAGHLPVSYATHLVAIARGAVAPPLAGTVAMARLTHLEERVRAMLQHNLPRGGVTRRHQVAAIAAAFAAALPLAGLRTHAAAQGRPDGVPAIQQPDTVVRHSIVVVSGGLLHIDLPTGGDVVVRGTEENTIRVTARTSTGGREPAVTLDRTADGASLRASFAASAVPVASFRTLEILVPRRYSVSLQSAGGSVRVDGLDGAVSGHTDGGEITIAHTNGRLALTSSAGAVRISDSHLDGYVSTDQGTVTVQRVTGSLAGTADSVAMTVAATSRADIVARKQDAEARAATAYASPTTAYYRSDKLQYTFGRGSRTDDRLAPTAAEDRSLAQPGSDGSVAIIAGRVFDESGRLVPHALVRAVANDGGASLQTTTNADGAYRLIFSGGGEQSFTVRVWSAGHPMALYVVDRQHGDDRIALDVRLHPVDANADRDSLAAQRNYLTRLRAEGADAYRDSVAAQWKYLTGEPVRGSVVTKQKYPTGDARTDSLIAQHKSLYNVLAGDTVYQVDSAGRVTGRTVGGVSDKPR